jgi:hypothetical protein
LAGKILWRTGVPFCAALFSFMAASLSASSLPANGPWKIYYNPLGQYCIDYPSRWQPAEAFEGAGLLLKPGIALHSKSPGEIDVEVLSDRRANANGEARAVLLKELQTHLDDLKKFERAENLEVLERRDILFFGSSALFVKDRYYDPQDRAVWVDEIIFINRGGTLYRLELTCRADELSRFEAVFTRLTSTFQFDCPARVTPLDIKASRRANPGSTSVIRSIHLYTQRGLK